ncbi:MAG: methyltransferase domain-containing protein [Hyphomicrobiaceae bacterium]
MVRKGELAIADNDLASARRFYTNAARRTPDSAAIQHRLGMVLAALGQRSSAAEHLATAMRLDPARIAAARELERILTQGVLPERTRLDSEGLIAAIAFDTLDRDLMCAAAMHQLASANPLANLLSHAREVGFDIVARRQCVERTRDLLTNALFITVLEHGIITRHDIERLLAAIRKALLLDLAEHRLQEANLNRFVAALLKQCWRNEFVWFETDAEKAQLDNMTVDPEAIASGNMQAWHKLVVASAYRPPESLLPGSLPQEFFEKLPDTPVRSAFMQRLDEISRIRIYSQAIPVLGSLADDTSRRVASQYEVNPYPRWTAAPVYPESNYFDHIAHHFAPGRLAFSSRPFNVLVAGCGTGRQAVSAALDYGPNAQITALDISASSLGYAAFMADKFKTKNISFHYGDINKILDDQPSFVERFHIIECGGVLHHMADPFEAWKKLIRCLAPGGIMAIGLYSSTARRNLPALRAQKDCPGPAASDTELRTWRHTLFERQTFPGSEFLRNRDCYVASGFRDLFLHVNEHVTSLPEIKNFLANNGLAFNGFVDLPVEALQRDFPEATSPGDLDQWAAWEEQHPNAFAGMYQFWCSHV